MMMHWKLRGRTLVGMVLLVVTVSAMAQSSIATTTVTDTIYRADGTTAAGTVLVTWPAFSSATEQTVSSGSTSATIVAGRVLTVQLAPNAGAMPIGSYYTVVYHLDDGTVSREFWVVPSSSTPVHLSAVKSKVRPISVAMQTVSKSYVDTAIATAISGHPLDSSTPYVLKSGDTMTGALTIGTVNAGTVNATTLNGAVSAAQLPVFQASGGGHSQGAVPDPGATAGTTRFLREDGTWTTPSDGGSTGLSAGVGLEGMTADYNFLQGSGSALTDNSGNGNHGTLGAGSSSAPVWTGKGLDFSQGQAGVSLPSALNTSQTFLFVFYAKPLPQNTLFSTNFQTLVTSTLGASGLNVMAAYINSIGGFEPYTYGLSTYVNGVSNTMAPNIYSGLHVYALVCGVSGSSVDHLYLDGAEVASYQAQGTSCGKQTSGNFYLGTANVPPWTAGSFNGVMYRAIFWPMALSSTQIQQASGAALAEVASRGVSTSPVQQGVGTPTINCNGDSITYGYGVTTPFCSELSLTDQPAYTTTNWGIPSVTAMALSGSDPNRVASYCRSVGAYAPIALLMEGTNDFTGGNSNTTAISVMSSYAADIATLRAAGCRVFAGTMISRTGTGANGASNDANKDAYDALILSQARSAGADGIIDYAANPLLGADGANSNTTYFQADGIHPTQTGVNLMATAASNSLNYYNSQYSLSNPNVVASATYQMLSGDRAITAAPSANAAYTMPDCTGPSGEAYTISNPQSAFAVTITGRANQPINGLTSAITIPSNSTVTLRDVPNAKSGSGCHWVM